MYDKCLIKIEEKTKFKFMLFNELTNKNKIKYQVNLT